MLFYLERTSAVLDRALSLDRSLVEYARRNLYVTGGGMWSDDYLQRCLAIFGPELLLFSTDDPYPYREGRQPRQFLENAPLDDAARTGFAHANWDSLTARAG